MKLDLRRLRGLVRDRRRDNPLDPEASTMSLQPTIATIRAGTERAEKWRRIFGAEVVAVRSPIPELCELPGLGVREVYYVDVSALSAEHPPTEAPRQARFARSRTAIAARGGRDLLEALERVAPAPRPASRPAPPPPRPRPAPPSPVPFSERGERGEDEPFASSSRAT